ncbi:MAG: cyclic nucleotide-binding domain-containing protein [bacterium]|nr:cyclic nucleotide-binding domain-containing protein [bacterium]
MAAILDHCRDLPERRLAAGETFIHEGKRSGLVWVLVEGTVDVLKGNVRVGTITEQGAVFGEVAVLLDVAHTASVRTRTPARFRVVEDTSVFLRVPDVTLEVSRLLAKRLQMVTSYLADLKGQFGGQDDHLGMVDEVLDSLLHHQRDADD